MWDREATDTARRLPRDLVGSARGMVERDVGELFICVGMEVIGSRKATAR
jgi:hypothetical protein